MMNARQAALDTLLDVIQRRQSLSTLLPTYRERVRQADRGLYAALTYGVLREHDALASLCQDLLNAPLNRQAETIAAILKLGIYQLLRMNLGDHGIINETVALANHNGCGQARGLINAILRRVQRERATYLARLEQRATYNLPAWLKSAYPHDKATLAQANITPPPFTLRLAPTLARTTWCERFLGAQINTLAPHAVTIPHGSDIIEHPDFIHGRVSVQDAAAQLAADLLAPRDGERILDACAAPGGKIGHLLEYAPAAELTALDHDEQRLEQVRENLARLGQTATLISADAGDTAQWWDGRPFDAILLDAPCSGSGVIRRHPDIPFLRTTKDLKRFPQIQRHLLHRLWATLRPGGRLLYATCSLLPAEDWETVEHFLSTQQDAHLRPLQHPQYRDTGCGILHLPDELGDGFYYALLEKST